MLMKDTKKLMCSQDYKLRFVAEYWQLKIRYEKLERMLSMWDNEKLNFTPTCPRNIYNIQLNAMKDYLVVLKERAKLENIDLLMFDKEK